MSAVELATGYVALVPSARNIASGLQKELGAPVEAVAAQSGARASAALTGRFSSGTRGLGRAVSHGILAGVAVVALLGGGVLKLGTDFKTAYNSIRVETGATGKSLQGLEGDFKAVLSQRPENMQQVALAIGKLHTGLDLTGPSLQEVAKSVLRLSSLTKTDLATNLTSTIHLFNNWGIAAAQQPAKLDELLRASQATGISVSDLASAMAKMGSPLRQLGFSFEDSAALLGLLNKSGIDAGAIMPALSKSIAKAAKEGKSAGDVFRSTFDAIRKAPTDTAAAGAAIAVFGARAGPNLAGLIRQGKLSYDDLSKSILHGGDTLAKAAEDTAGFSGKFKIFLNQLRVAIEPIAIATVTFAISAMTAAGPYLKRFADIVGVATAKVASFFAANPGAKFAVLATIIGTLLGGAVIGLASKLAFLFSPAALIVGAILAIAAGGIYAYTHVAKFRDVVDRMGASISSFAQSAIPKVKAAFAAIVLFATQLIDRIRKVDFGAIFARAAQIVKPVLAGLATLGAAILKIGIAVLPVLASGFRIAFSILQKVLPPAIVAFYVIARVAGVVLGAALKVVGNATSFLANHMTALKPVLLAVAGGFLAFKAGQAVVTMFNRTAVAARGAVTAARSVVTTVIGAPARLAAFFRSGSDTLRLRFWQVRDAASSVASKIVSGARALLGWAKQGIVATASAVRQTAAFVAQKVAMVAAAVAQKAMAAAQWLLNAAMDANPIVLIVVAIAALAAGVIFAYQHFGPFRAVVDAVGRALATVARVVMGAVVGAFNWIKGHWPLLLAILTGPFGLAVLLIAKNWDKITAGISTAFHAVVGFFTSLPGRILGALGDMGSMLLGAGRLIIHGLGSGITGGWNAILGFVASLGGRTLQALGAVGTWLVNAGRQVIHGLGSGITTGWTIVLGFVSSIAGRTLQALGNVASWLLNAGMQVIHGLGAGITIGWNAVAGFFSRMASTVVGLLGKAGSWLADIGFQIIVGLFRGITDSATNVFNWFSGLGGTVVGWLGDVGSWLLEVGKKIMEGLLNGIKAGIGKVKDFVGGIAGKIVSWKGPPAYDATILVGNGQLIMSGLMSGIRSAMPALRRQLGDVNGALADGINPTVNGRVATRAALAARALLSTPPSLGKSPGPNGLDLGPQVLDLTVQLEDGRVAIVKGVQIPARGQRATQSIRAKARAL